MLRLIPTLAFLLLITAVSAAPAPRLVPAFAEQVSGVNGSTWQSELRLFNATVTPQVVTLTQLLPSSGSACAGFAPVTLPPGGLAQIRSIGCLGPGAAALEISADENVEITSVMTKLGGTPQDTCCLAGFTQVVPVRPLNAVYRQKRTIANLQIPIAETSGMTPLGRHNLGFVNPNPTPLMVTLRYFVATGEFIESPSLPFYTAVVPPHSYFQLNNFLNQIQLPITNPVYRGYWRIEASADLPFYAFDSYIDTFTNDATITEPR